MALDPTVVRGLTRPITTSLWLRIMKRRHAGNPLGTGPGSSRFASRASPYTILYGGKSLLAAIAEAILRDRFSDDARAPRELDISEVQDYSITEISTKDVLNVLDLRNEGAFRLGVKTDAVGARNHRAGQAFAERLHGEFPSIDGILYASRMTGCDCVAVFDRAIAAKLQATPAVELERVAALRTALADLSVTLVSSP